MVGIDREAVRRKVIRRFWLKVFKAITFVIHVGLWCWTALLGLPPNLRAGDLTPIPVMLIWGFLLFLHWRWATGLLKNPRTQWLERATEAEIVQERKRRGLVDNDEETVLEKQKRTMRLSDDGELVEIESEHDMSQQKSKR
jgi:hypothetical protein